MCGRRRHGSCVAAIERATAPMAPPAVDGGSSRRDLGPLAVWLLRALLVIPFVLMGPEIVSMLVGRPDAVAHLSASTADVLGTSTFLIFMAMLAVTPIQSMTGWRWHIVLRRDY